MIIKNKIMGKYVRGLYLLLARLMLLIFVASSIYIIANSYVNIKTSFGIKPYIIEPTAVGIPYNESMIMNDIFRNSVSDIINMIDINRTMEVDGEYNGKKVINILDYAQPSSLNEYSESKIEYYLDDLIKWSNYGFEYERVMGNWFELNDYFRTNSMTDLEKLKIPMDNENEVAPYIPNLEIDTYESPKGTIYIVELIKPRYSALNGKGLEECSRSVKEYEELKTLLVSVSDKLSNDFIKYSNYNMKYNTDNTSIRYLYKTPSDVGNRIFSNITEDRSIASNDDISSYFSKLEMFLLYNPDKLQLQTNSNLDVLFMRDNIARYNDILGDGSRIWIGVSNSNTSIMDDINIGRQYYNRLGYLYYALMLVIALSIIIFLTIIIKLTRYEGRTLIKEDLEGDNQALYGIKLRKIDNIPLEIISLIVAIIIIYVLWGYNKLYDYILKTADYKQEVTAISVLYILPVSICITSIYLSIVRRVKKKVILKNTFLYEIIIKGREAISGAYNNRNVAVMTWIPYSIFLLINLVLVLNGYIGIIIAFILDLAVGILIYRTHIVRRRIIEDLNKITEGDLSYTIDFKTMNGDNLKLAKGVNKVGQAISSAVSKSMQDEKMKTDLITNVSHDIKTPLTSIISYIKLLKMEDIDNEKAKNYIDILDVKSQRLKQLTNDLVEVSKISSGNISLDLNPIDPVELVMQTFGEFSEKIEQRNLQAIVNKPAYLCKILADSRRTYRIMENIFNNIVKYALEGTRVYLDMKYISRNSINYIQISIKNISASPLSVAPTELAERFVRGDISRGTEGHGLGLSIAKSLTIAQGGEFDVNYDGDLFKVELTFECI